MSDSVESQKRQSRRGHNFKRFVPTPAPLQGWTPSAQQERVDAALALANLVRESRLRDADSER